MGYRSGTVTIASNARDAQVTVDGRNVGSAPVSLALREGEHRITVSAFGVTRRKLIPVAHGSVKAVEVDFALGELAIRGVPSGVECFMDGRTLARATWDGKWFSLTEGRHTLVCDDPSGDVHSQTLDVRGAQRYTFTWPR